MDYLQFGQKNTKLGKQTITFALPAGHFCPFAKECLSKANKVTGKITDGKHTKFRCFGASVESRYPLARKKVWYNANLLRKAGLTNVEAMTKLIVQSIVVSKGLKNKKYVRIHDTGGDFFNLYYLQAWLEAAKHFPSLIFYTYTKAVSLVFHEEMEGNIPDNFSITYSKGGTQDNLIDKYKLKHAIVVNYVEEARKLGLVIDIDDSLARNKNYKKSFALLIHGTQKAGTNESKANYFHTQNQTKKKLKELYAV